MVSGAVQACEKLNRNDIIIVSAGNCKNGMDLVKAGKVRLLTYQSAETAGALPIELAIDWFNGLTFPPIRYLPIQLITEANSDNFYPAQW